MKVLMYGWEFPPYNTGGLGIACYGLTKSLAKKNIHITFVLPTLANQSASFLTLLSANVLFKQVDSPLRPYLTSTQYEILRGNLSGNLYGESLFEEIQRYANQARIIASMTDHDVIHCHDWMTFLAGIFSKQVSKKPLVVHVHSTEFDRGGGNALNQYVYDLEKYGMQLADKVIAVSNYTKQKIMHHYGIPEDKIEVVHNAIEQKQRPNFPVQKHEKIVLYLGRVTLQKGPDYFIEAAKRVLEVYKDVKFIVAGTGDMERKLMERVAELGISKHVLFAGFLSGQDIQRAYQMADLYVMPSVSEPFGLTALEAMHSGTPVIISKQSGVTEIVSHCLQVDFWDIDQMANKIVAVLKSDTLHSTIKQHASWEVQKISWDTPAQKCIDIYNRLVR